MRRSNDNTNINIQIENNPNRVNNNKPILNANIRGKNIINNYILGIQMRGIMEEEMKKMDDKYQKEIDKIKEDNAKKEEQYQEDIQKLKEENERHQQDIQNIKDENGKREEKHKQEL